jgi:hypothetical protein
MPIADKLDSLLSVGRDPRDASMSFSKDKSSLNDFISKNKSVQEKFIEKIRETIHKYFDYTFTKDGKIMIYIKPKGDKNWNEIKPDEPIKFNAEATILIIPKDDEVLIKVKINEHDDKFKSKSMIWKTKVKLDDDKIIKILSDKINTLFENIEK